MVTHLAQRLFDQSPSVRAAVTQVVGNWLLDLLDRFIKSPPNARAVSHNAMITPFQIFILPQADPAASDQYGGRDARHPTAGGSVVARHWCAASCFPNFVPFRILFRLLLDSKCLYDVSGLKYQGENEEDLKDKQDFMKPDPDHYPPGCEPFLNLLF